MNIKIHEGRYLVQRLYKFVARKKHMEKVIEMKGITKVFPGTVANDDVSFDLNKSETHVLLGENGAGKQLL